MIRLKTQIEIHKTYPPPNPPPPPPQKKKKFFDILLATAQVGLGLVFIEVLTILTILLALNAKKSAAKQKDLEPSSHFFRTTTGIKSGPDILKDSRVVMIS